MNILNQTGSIGTSSKYQVITSQEVLNKFQSEGWTVQSVQKQRVKKAEKQGFQGHLVRMRHPDLAALGNGLFPEVVLRNSYDGTSSLKLMLGVYRLVCSNGLIAGSTINSFSVRHVGPVWDNVAKATERLVAMAPDLTEQLKAMGSKELTSKESETFAIEAAESVLGIDPVESYHVAGSLLRVRRMADKGNDVFSVFNRIQENAINGHYKKLDSRGMYRSARAVRSIDRNIEINRGLWDLAMKKVG